MPSVAVMVRFDVVGFHHWPDAPHEVAYLRDRHRHVFHFEVEVPVFHNDRDTEFHMLKKLCVSKLDVFQKSWLGLIPIFDFGDMSCEMIAITLGAELVRSNVQPRMIQVWEDNECGAKVCFN